MRKRNCWYGRLSAAALFTVMISASCSGHAPELLTVEYRLSVRPLDPKGTATSEQLSVFAAVRDEDGFKDLAALHVLHDRSEYIWTLYPEAWTHKDQNKESWVGATGLSSPGSGLVPRGLYRVILEDLAGDSDEATFTLGSGVETGAVFPVVHLKNDLVAVLSKYPRTELLFLDEKDGLLRVVDAPREAMSLERLYGAASWKNDVKSIVAHAYDPQRSIGIYSWIQTITP